MSSAKKVLRKAALQAIREMESSTRDAQSAAVCDAVWSRVILPASNRLRARKQEVPLCSNAAPHAPQSSAAPRLATQHQPRMAVLSYLPMYYELSLLPLMQRIWTSAEQPQDVPQDTSVQIDIFVPHMIQAAPHSLPSSSCGANPPPIVNRGGGGEMMFVQIAGPEDLNRSFTPRGKMKILELTEAAEENLMQTVRRDADALLQLRDIRDGGDLTLNLNELKLQQQQRDGRRGYLCFGPTAEMLLTGRRRDAAAPREPLLDSGSLIGSSSSSPMADGGRPPALHTTIVVITPAALYDAGCCRLGKGGGYYDNFLRRMSHIRSSAEVVVVGVGLSPQLLGGTHVLTTYNEKSNDAGRGVLHLRRTSVVEDGANEEEPIERIPVDPWDMPVDELIVALGSTANQVTP